MISLLVLSSLTSDGDGGQGGPAGMGKKVFTCMQRELLLEPTLLFCFSGLFENQLGEATASSD